MRIIIFFFCICSSLFSWRERYNEGSEFGGVDKRLNEFKINAFPWNGAHDLKMVHSYAIIARINEGIRFGCAGAIVSDNVFATLVECDYHMFHYIKGSFPADDQMNHYSSTEDIQKKFQEMVEDGLIYIYYGAKGMHDGKFIKVKSLKKMETHMFLTTVENFEQPAKPILPADTEFYNEMIRDRSPFEKPKYQCIIFGFYRYESYFLSHPKQPHFHAIRLKFNGREDGTNRPKLKLNNKKYYNVGFIPTFDEYGTPIYCQKMNDMTIDRFKLVAFLDKTALQTIKSLDALRSTFKITKSSRDFVNTFAPMENEYRVKRDSFEIYFAVHDDQD